MKFTAWRGTGSDKAGMHPGFGIDERGSTEEIQVDAVDGGASRRTVSSAAARFRSLPVVWRVLVPLVAVVSSVLIVYETYRFRNWDLDDFLIVARYSRNIAAGNGWVFNEGTRWNASTSPLNTIGVTVVSVMTGSARSAGHLVSALSLIAGSLSALFVFTRRRMIAPAVITPLAIASLTLLQQTTGLEPALLVGLLFVFLALADSGRQRWPMAGVIALARPEGALLIAITGIRERIITKRTPWRGIALALAVCTPWYLFSAIYFGSLAPGSLANKVAQRESGQWGSGNVYWRFTKQLVIGNFGSILTWALILLALIGFISCLKRDRIALAELGIFVIAQQVGYLLVNPPGAPWYFPPAFVMAFMYAAIGLESIIESLLTSDLQRLLLVGAVAAILFAPKIPMTDQPIPHFISFYTRGAEIVQDRHPEARSVAILEVGTFAYKSPLDVEVVDLIGLTTENREYFTGRNNDRFFESPPDLVLLHWQAEASGKDPSSLTPVWKQEAAVHADARFASTYTFECVEYFPGNPSSYAALAVFVRRDLAPTAGQGQQVPKCS